MEIKTELIKENGAFPNNPYLPLLHYKKVLESRDTAEILKLFETNGWKHGWVDGIFSFHHFHSNAHEVIGIASGSCQVQIGGEEGSLITVEAGDVIVLPAGVSHKNRGSSSDFQCVGGYSTEIFYDMHRGEEEELAETKQTIAKVPLPDRDPVFGKEGPLLHHWS